MDGDQVLVSYSHMINGCEIIISCILVSSYISPGSSFWNLIAHYSHSLVGFCAACNNYWSFASVLNFV